jgi:hypothetical protein
VDLHKRVVPVGEADLSVHCSFDAFDLAEGKTRVRALVVAVLENHHSDVGPAQKIDTGLERLEGRAR